MTDRSLSAVPPIDWGAIEALVKIGKTVISAEDSTVIDLAMKAIEEGRTATFYVKLAIFTEIIERYWTPKRVTVANLEPISLEEVSRIKADFNIELDGCLSSQETCPRCGSIYGTYEFIQQGIKEHGERVVKAVFSFEGVSVLQIHPRQNIICQTCDLVLATVVGPHSYIYRDWNHSYACCL